MKKLDNKGFSLVELIIVIAIMAVLIGVLAPQFLRYVERSRYQRDASAVEELRNAAEIALANDDIASETTATTRLNIDADGVITYPAGHPLLQAEITSSIGGTDLEFTSDTFGDVAPASPVNVEISNAAGTFTVSTNNVPARP